MSSLTEQRYLLSRFVEKSSLADAAWEAGISEAEARLIDAAVTRGELALPAPATDDQPPAPVLPLRAARAHLLRGEPSPSPAPSRLLAAITPPPEGGRSINKEEAIMPCGKLANGQSAEEVKAPDFERAVKIYRHDIKPANEKSGEHAQAASTAYKAIKKECRVNTRAAKFVFQLAGESEEKRNDVLRSIRGLLSAMHIGITDDLVSQAEGEDNGAAIVPQAEAERPELATVQ